jgi:hypothetical protein
MPYKDSERKKQWEREHREQRNARRRRQSVPARPILSKSTFDADSAQTVQTARNRLVEMIGRNGRNQSPLGPGNSLKPAHHPNAHDECRSIWKSIAASIFALGIVVIAAFSGMAITTDIGLPFQPRRQP